MKGFVRNLKLKRALAMFLVISIVLTTFLTSICVDTKRVYADSNDRRSSLMNLSATKQKTKFNSLEDVKNIDEASLRVVALYLTNFYIPWLSSIDTDFKPADADAKSSDKDDDGKNADTEANGAVSQDYKKNMVNALVKHCSFDEKTAKYIVDYIMQENLSTCQPVYMKKSDLEIMWQAVLHASAGNKTDSQEILSVLDYSTIGFYNRRFKDTNDTVEGWNIDKDGFSSVDTLVKYKTGLGDAKVTDLDNKDINGFQNYVDYFGTKKVGGDSTEYVPVTYPIFLQVMDYCYRVASVDTLKQYKDNASNRVIWNYKKNFDTYSINNRKDFVDDEESESGVDENFKENIPLIQFWTNNKKDSFAPIFSNNEECMQAYAMVQNFVDIQNGYSSGFLAVGIHNSFYKDAKESGAGSDYALALGQQMYTNWVGDLVVNTGKYRLIALPGCCNPYMLSTVTATESASGAYANTVPAQNLFAIASVNNGWLRYDKAKSSGGNGNKSNSLFVFTDDDVDDTTSDNTKDTDDDTKDTDDTKGSFIDATGNVIGGIGDAIANKVSDIASDASDSHVIGGSLFNLAFWKLYQGTKKVKFDDSVSNDTIVKRIADTVNNSDLGNAKVLNFDGDRILFPSWMHIAQSETYHNIYDKNEGEPLLDLGIVEIGDAPTDVEAVDFIHCDDKRPKGETPFKSKGSGYNTMTRLGARDEYGHVVYNGNFIYRDTFEGVDSDTPLGKLFGHGSITEGTLMTRLENGKEEHVDLANIKMNSVSKLYSDTSSSLVNTFNNETYTALFTSIFLSYSLAYFNEGKTEYKKNSNDTNCIDLKTHFGNFPSYTNNIDWSNIFGSTMQEEIMSFLYYLLHPTEGISYVATWLKNKIGGFLLKWHEDIVGSTDSNSTTGMTKYLGFSGYQTVPSLNDIEWVAKILDMYNNIIVYLIIVMCLIMLCYILTGTLTLQRGIIGVLSFSILSFFPPYAINMVVDTSNKVSSTIYSSKFDYWALCQMQTYLTDFANAVKSRGDKDMSSYTAFVLKEQSKTSNSIGGTSSTYYGGVRLKWMSPKKYNTMATVSEALTKATEGDQATYLRNFVLNAVGNATDSESFVDNNGSALYLYREYTDIYRYAVGSYHVADTYNYDGTLMTNDPLTNNLVLDATPGKYGCSIIRVEGDYNSVLDNIKEYEDILQINNLSDAELKVLADAEEEEKKTGKKVTRTFSDDLGIRTANNVLFHDLVGANTNMPKKGKEIDLSNEDNPDGSAIRGTSSIWSVNTGFLYDTIKLDDQLEHKDKLSYYNYTQGNTCFTLSSAYLMNYNQAWGIAAKQKERLQAIADGDVKISYDKEIKDVGTSDDDNIIDNTELLGLPLDYYAKDISGIQSIENLKDDKSKAGSSMKIWQDLSSYFYGLYTESPFYYFNFNIRDQIAAFPGTNYMFDPEDPGNSGTSDDGQLNNIAKLMLSNNQEYFFNLSDGSGAGYGQLRDFMNMHDLFYYIMPALKQGVDLARLYDDLYRFELDDGCAVHYDSYEGKVVYSGEHLELESFVDKYYKKEGEFTEEEKYKIWHTLNNYSILNAYSAWLDTMMDCKYAKKETIRVQGEKYEVYDPLCPTSYFKVDADSGKMIEGRYMVFSRSEMAYYGLDESDLTTVERKIIEVQDNVYDTALKLLNYYTMSDETLIQALSMIELFEFNKTFSQETFFGKDYVMYPQGYELKAFSYDAYLRLIVSEASGEDLMTGGGEDELGNTQTNESIYTRIQKNTSLFFSVFLLLNDLLAVYIIPGFKIFFILLIFFSSILLIVASAIKLELNMAKVTWNSLITPLLSFLAISVGMSVLVAMFMSNGASGVVSSDMIINLGDPTMVTIVMLVINVIVTILYFRLIKKSLHECRTYTKAIAENIGGTAAGVFGAVVGSIGRGRDFSSHSGHNISSTASQRGRDNSPASGRDGVGVGGAMATGAGAAGAVGMLSKKEQEQVERTNARTDASAGMNRWDKKAYAGANAREDKARDKYNKLAHKAELEANRHGNGKTPGKASKLTNARLNRAKARLESKQQYSDDVAKYGRITAKKKQIGRIGNTVKDKAQSAGTYVKDKAKSGVSRLGYLKQTASGKAKSAGTKTIDQQTYNAGANVARVGNARRNAVAGGKKGTSNSSATMKRGASSTVSGVRSGVNSTVNNVRSSVSRSINKGKSGLSSARAAVNNSRTFANNAGSPKRVYSQTTNRK